jgi:probable addiction module antidote protein
MTHSRDIHWDDYMAQALQDPAEAAAYLDAMLAMNDHAGMLMALRHVAKAHGMAEVARRADLGEKTLFKTLGERGNPTISTLSRVLLALGLRLRIEPIST